MQPSAEAIAPTGQSVPERLSYPVPETAMLIGLSTRSVWTLVDTGELPSFKSSGRRLVALDDIKAYIAAKVEAERLARAAAADAA